MNEKQNKMSTMPMSKLVLDMGFPLMLSLLIQSLYNVVDSIFVARVSEKALTATSLAFPMQHLMIALSVGTAVGLNAVMARAAGAKDEKRACSVATTGFVICLAVSCLFTVIGFLFSGAIASSMTDDPETASMTAVYMGICVMFSQGIFIEKVAQRMLTSVGLSKYSMYSQLAAALSNIILDPILIFGWFGLPAMGVRGAAIATVAGQWLGAIAALYFNKMRNPTIHIRFRGWKWNWEDVRAIYRIGMPSMITQSLSSVMTALVNAILMPISSTAVAFFGVYFRLQNFVFMPVNGMGQAVLPIAAFNLGAGSRARVREVWRVALRYALAVSLFGLLLFEALPGQLLSLFSAGEEMMKLGVPALRIIAVTFPLATFTYVSGYYCSGLGNAMVNLIGGLLRQVIVLVPALALLARLFGVRAGWFAFWCAELAAFGFCLVMVRRLVRRRLGTDAE